MLAGTGTGLRQGMCAVDRMQQDKCSFDLSLEADTADADISFMNENGNLSVSFK